MFFEIVGETARAGTFVPRDLDILTSKRAIGEMNL